MKSLTKPTEAKRSGNTTRWWISKDLVRKRYETHICSSTIGLLRWRSLRYLLRGYQRTSSWTRTTLGGDLSRVKWTLKYQISKVTYWKLVILSFKIFWRKTKNCSCIDIFLAMNTSLSWKIFCWIIHSARITIIYHILLCMTLSSKFILISNCWRWD